MARSRSYQRIPGRPTGPGNRPIRKGVYAGPVTDGKTEVTVCSPPSARSFESAGNSPRSIAAVRVSGLAPSATRMTTLGIARSREGTRESKLRGRQVENGCGRCGGVAEYAKTPGGADLMVPGVSRR